LTEARSRLAADKVKTKVKVLAQISYVGDARGHSVLSRHGASTRRLDKDTLGPQQDRHFGGFDLAFRLGAAVQPQPSRGRDDRAGLAPFDNPAPQHVGAADKLGDKGAGRVLVYFGRSADLLDPAVRQDGNAVRQGQSLGLVVRDINRGLAQPALQIA
jgi:hypothetical protein